MVWTRTSAVPWAMSQRRKRSNTPVTDQRVEQHHAPDGDPVDVPHAGGGAVEIGERAAIRRHLPEIDGDEIGHERADQGREPRRQAIDREHDQQQRHRHQRGEPRREQIAERIEDLVEHAFPPSGLVALSTGAARPRRPESLANYISYCRAVD